MAGFFTLYAPNDVILLRMRIYKGLNEKEPSNEK